MAKYFVMICLFAFVTPFLNAQTHIPAGKVNGIWEKEKSPYYINGEIRIAEGDKLVIEPGVKVIFTNQNKFFVNGVLEAIGTGEDSIYFIPKDTALGWGGISIDKAENLTIFEYCIVRYGSTDTPELLKLLQSFDLTECDTDPECEAEFAANGGGILINNSDPVIRHCLISDNKSLRNGGGIAIINKSNPQISFCQITNNRAAHLSGGGIYISGYSNPLINNCIIEGNFAVNIGGGIYIHFYSNAVIDNCVVKKNTGGNRGGGIAMYTSAKPKIQNSLISENFSHLGGGIYIDEFYNEFREQIGKIDIKIMNVRIENNSADYGGGLWIRDTMGELLDVTVCHNTAMTAGGGIHIEHNPTYFKFSPKKPCNIYMNFARIMGNDLFRLGGEAPIYIPLDTFTVKYYSSLNAEPVEKFPLTMKNFKLAQVNADLYVSPDGNDSNSGLSKSEPLNSLEIALLKILADSTNPRTIYLTEGEYIFSETNNILLLEKHKYVSLKGMGMADIMFGTDRISVFIPWWINKWALMIYVTTITSVILIIWNVRIKRITLKHELEKEKFEAQKLMEVDELKSRFFSNISHEFRTPITLITGPAGQILELTKDERIKEKISLIHSNADRLNDLVNHLMDLSKIEANEMKLQVCHEDITMIIKALLLSFEPLAYKKNISLRSDFPEKQPDAYIDKDKFEKIMINVLSNAFKFTPEGGEVEVSLNHCSTGFPAAQPDDNFLEISIRDTGIGIPPDRIDKIFDRFYQVECSHTYEQEGTGIGLALTKELVELHKGKIIVESKEGEGSLFTIILPAGKEYFSPDEICEKDKDKSEVKAIYNGEKSEPILKELKLDIEIISGNGKPLVLVVEDNTALRIYIKELLLRDYAVLEAINGEDGFNKAIAHLPDLILSDIMMPGMDGYQLCEKLNSDERTSHIPLILLTAKATNQDKIGGYQAGADDYIFKPFDAQVLKARISNLIAQRKRLREQFKNDGLWNLDNANISNVDKAFLKRIFELINNNLSDASFGVESFAKETALNRVTLHKKLVALIGEPPGELIKRMRICKAAKLIENNGGNISEIAIRVGFNNPAYFSECFRKQFGISPSHYRQKFTSH